MWLFLLPSSFSLPPCGYILAAMQLFPAKRGYSCCHAAINCCHVDIFLLQCSYSRHHEAIFTAMQLFLPQYGYFCCHAAINCCHVDIFLLQCSYSCHHEAILAAMQLFLPQCGYSCCHAAINCCHVAILAAMQTLIVAMWIYTCRNAAIPAIMRLFLLPCSYIPATMWLFLLLLFLPMTPFSCSCLQAVLAAMQLYSLPLCS